MPLQPIDVSIPFTGGLETKSDEKVVLPTKLTVLDNGEFTKRGTVRCRPGHFAMTDRTVPGTKILAAAHNNPSGTKLAHATRGEELILVTDERLYSADEATSRWLKRDQYLPVTHTLEEMAHVNANQTYPTAATAGGVRGVAWLDSRGGVRFSVYNATTGAAYALDQAVDGGTGTSRPYMVPVENNVLLLWAEHTTNEIRGRLIRASNIYASLTEAYFVVVPDLASTRKYAVATDGTYCYIAYEADGSVVAAGVGVAKVDAFGTTVWKTSCSTDTPTCLDIAYADTTYCCAIWYNGTNVKRQQFSAVGVGAGVTNLGAVAGVTRVAIGATTTTAGNDFSAAWEVSGGSVDVNSVTIVDLVNTNATIRHAHLASTGFLLKSTGRCVFLLGHQSRTGLQNAYYMYTDEALIIGQLLYQTAANRPTSDHLARGYNLEIALGFKRQLDSEGTSAVFTHDGISLATFNPLPSVHYAEAGGTCYLSGSALWAYDGQSLTEANLFMYPDMDLTVAGSTDIAESSASGGLTEDAQYSYRVFYEVLRANGERVRSAALVISKTFTTSSGNDTMTLTVPTLGHTRWRNDLDIDEEPANVAIVAYRTIGNDTTGLYYRITDASPAVTGVNGYVYNDQTLDAVTIIDKMSDDTLVSKEVDYLTRGELENVAPPGPALVCSVADRLFIAGGAVPKGTIRYSKLRFAGEPAQFSDLLVIDDLPESPGDITSLSYNNETLVALRESGISAVSGAGTDNTGTSGGYESQAVTSDVGCSGVSVVIPEGIMFVSSKGIYLLDQSFGVVYIGAAVERYNSQTFTGACVIPGTNQVVFSSSSTGNSSRSLMYDYYFKEWAAWTIHADSLVIWKQTTPVFLTTEGTTLYRDMSEYDSAIFTDNGSTYSFKIRTGPLRLTDCLQDFARLWRFSLLGTYRSAHNLLVSLYYDRDTAPYETFTWDPSTVITSSYWGDGATWGSDDYWGGSRDGNTYQFEHVPMRQKFSTIRFEFAMIPGTTPGAGYEITELALRCGVKPGLQRQSATRKF